MRCTLAPLDEAAEARLWKVTRPEGGRGEKRENTADIGGQNMERSSDCRDSSAASLQLSREG
jgi:hypothetical protein